MLDHDKEFQPCEPHIDPIDKMIDSICLDSTHLTIYLPKPLADTDFQQASFKLMSKLKDQRGKKKVTVSVTGVFPSSFTVDDTVLSKLTPMSVANQHIAKGKYRQVGFVCTRWQWGLMCLLAYCGNVSLDTVVTALMKRSRAQVEDVQGRLF